MKNGWTTRKLGDVCTTIQDGAHESPQQQFDTPGKGRFLYITSKNIRTNYLELKNVSYVERDFHDRIYPRCQPKVGDVLLTKDGANTGNVALNTIDEPFSLLSSVCLIKTNLIALKPGFLCYYLQSPDGLKSILGQMTGAAIKRIILRDVKLAPIPLPPLAEQQRIVSILDEAFAGIATAKANAEKNLQNARALFESHLQSVFTQHGKDWVKKPLGDLAQFKNGLNYNRSSGGQTLPVVGVADFQDNHFVPLTKLLPAKIDGELANNYAIQRDDILTVRSNGSKHLVGRCMLVGDVNEVVSYSGFIIRIRFDAKNIFPKYLLHFMKCRATRGILTAGGGGANITNINQEKLSSLLIPLPPYKTQSQLASTLDNMLEETQRLANIYERKLAALDALKKSMLHRAFSGELTKESAQPLLVSLLPPLPQLPGITPIDLQAGILAIAYQFREQKNSQWDFGHVIGEKNCHMVEALVEIDLGRKPVQDPQGPDDHNHFKKVEHRAKMAGYFTFQKHGMGYMIVKGERFDSLVAKTRAVLGGLNQKVDEVIQLMLPLNLQRAEVVATVYAAWNNLLMDKQTPTDEQIVLAAREKWHPDKLKIPRENFFKTIEWIRKKGICPQGKGKRVVPRTK